MKRFLSEKVLTRCELAAASLLTVFLVAFHAIFFLRAGPLWRDEISSLALATKPTVAEFWRSLPFDPSRRAIFFCCGCGMALASERTTLRCAHWVC